MIRDSTDSGASAIPAEACFRVAMASAGTGMAILGLDGRWMAVNPALCRLLGRGENDLVGASAWECVHPDDRTRLQQSGMQLSDCVQARAGVDLRCLHVDGRVVELVADGGAVRDAQDRPQCVIAHFRDVTAQREAERRLHDLTASLEQRVQARTVELEATNRRLESFVHGVSHDLRAPLRTIDGFASQLARSTEGRLDEASTGHLERIRGASQRMASLLDSLLELARINRAGLRPMRVDVSLLVEWALAELQETHPGREAELHVQSGLELVGDERLLKTMLSQLLANAWRFSSSRPKVRIQVEGERRDTGLVISIRDQGIGFDMTYASKLFEPFQRLHGADQGAGHGIGLTIAQQIAARHGGMIRAEGQPDRGATFHVELIDQAGQDAGVETEHKGEAR